MSSEKPSFLSQPVVKNIFMYRNGDPYYEARRIVINQKRVSNFETLLREVTGGVQPPFGAVRNIYTPRGGHKVDCLDHIQSGEQYVAAGRERFKKLDYLHIGSRKKRMMQTLPLQPKPVPQSRIIVSARFLKPIREPCPIFVVANGDVLTPAMRLLIAQRMLSQFDRILEMITEKMGLRILGGVRSLYTFEGQQVSDGTQLESGQFYVAVGREKFKKLPYTELLFTKPRGARRMNGSKTFSLPPIYRSSKQNGNSKSTVRGSDSGEGDFKTSPPAQNDNSKQLSSLVREISQARLLSLRKKRSGLAQGVPDNDDVDDGNSDTKTPQDQVAEEKPTTENREATGPGDEKEDKTEEAVAENTTEEETTTTIEEEVMKEYEKTNHDAEKEREDVSPDPSSENGTGEQEMNGEMEEDSGKVEENSREVEGDSGEVEKDGEQVEGDSEQVEGDSEQVEGESEQVEGNSEQVEGDNEQVEGDSEQVEGESEQVEGDSEQVEGDSEQVEEDSEPVEGKSELVERDSEQVEGDSGEVEKDGEKVEGDSEQVEGDSEPVEGDSEPVEKDSEQMEGDSEPVEKDSEQMEGDSEPVEKDSEQMEGDSEQVEKDGEQVEGDQGSEEPPASTENVENDIETEGQESQQAVNGKDSSDGEQEAETKMPESAIETSAAEEIDG